MGMTGVFNRLITRIFPPVPEDIRDDVAILRANRIETLTPMLFLMLAATTPAAIYAGVATVHPIIRIGFPVTLAIAGILGFAFLVHNRGRRMSPRRARRMIREASWAARAASCAGVSSCGKVGSLAGIGTAGTVVGEVSGGIG